NELWKYTLPPPVNIYANRTYVRATTGRAFTGVVATFTTTDPLSKPGDFTATLTWGDGHTSAGTGKARAGGGFEGWGTNTYAAKGSYSVSVQITGIISGKASVTSTVQVSDPVITAVGKQLTATKGQPFTGVVATFTDADPNALAAWYTATIAWGDGH